MISGESITDVKGYDMISLMDSLFGNPYRRAPRRGLLERVNRAMALHRSRARLGTLEPHLLDDIGIDKVTADTEAARAVWDAPETWIR
jgi:uncharacterized protein YjiS (DUF1127 family)